MVDLVAWWPLILPALVALFAAFYFAGAARERRLLERTSARLRALSNDREPGR